MKRFSMTEVSSLVAFIVVSLSPLSICAAGFSDFKNGFTRAENAAPFLEIKKTFGYRPAFLVGVGDSGLYYGLSRDGLGVSYYDLVSKVTPEGWPLTRWPYLQRVPEILHDHDQVGVKEWKERIEYTAHMPYAGCLNQHPLRYGDIENDGASDIVLVLNGELIVFSPRYQRTVFSAFVEASDWYRESMEGMTLESDLVDGESYQYLSEHLLYNGYNHKAHRSYTKLYVGDYDGDGNSDILTWQKVYASNKVNDAQGFHLVRNELKHYERDLKAQETTKQGITGEYLPQATDQATIQQWLADNKLTWQKGFPSVSECAGEEGKPIPEMHDPLLNDPDVLR